MCLFRALALHMHGNQQLENETSKFSNLFNKKMDELTADQFQGVHMNDIPIVEDLLNLTILQYDIQRHKPRNQAYLDNCDNETCTSTQFFADPKETVN